MRFSLSRYVGIPCTLNDLELRSNCRQSEQFGEVAVGEQSTLLVSLLAEAERLVQQSLGSGPAIDPLLHVLRGGEVEEDRDKLGVRDPLAVGGRVIDADGHPQCLAVGEVLLGAHVLGYNFKNHIGT